MNRRGFINSVLRTAAMSALSPMLRPLMSYAAEANSAQRFLVMIYIPGGWDVTLLTDPLTHAKFATTDKDVFIEYDENAMIKANRGLMLGPAGLPLKPFLNDLTVVNGLVMRRDTGHQALRDTMKRGHNGSSGDLIVEFADALSPSPMGVLVDGGIDLGVKSVRLVRPQEVLDESTGNYIDLIADGLDSPFELIAPAQAGYRELMKVRRDAFAARIAEHRKRGGSVDKNTGYAIMAEALAKNLARGAMIDITDEGAVSLDTHVQHAGRHLQSLSAKMSTVANIFKLFKETPMASNPQVSLFNQTTFVVYSEFSRTPYRNGSEGKDHNVFTNSVLFAGGGLQGGRSIGGSRILKQGDPGTGRALHIGQPIDYKSGVVVSKSGGAASLIFPENIAATTLRLLGAPDTVLRRELDGFSPLPL
jgi:uncharacterized protein (DUF1501 family)